MRGLRVPSCSTLQHTLFLSTESYATTLSLHWLWSTFSEQGTALQQTGIFKVLSNNKTLNEWYRPLQMIFIWDWSYYHKQKYNFLISFTLLVFPLLFASFLLRIEFVLHRGSTYLKSIASFAWDNFFFSVEYASYFWDLGKEKKKYYSS